MAANYCTRQHGMKPDTQTDKVEREDSHPAHTAKNAHLGGFSHSCLPLNCTHLLFLCCSTVVLKSLKYLHSDKEDPWLLFAFSPQGCINAFCSLFFVHDKGQHGSFIPLPIYGPLFLLSPFLRAGGNLNIISLASPDVFLPEHTLSRAPLALSAWTYVDH